MEGSCSRQSQVNLPLGGVFSSTLWYKASFHSEMGSFCIPGNLDFIVGLVSITCSHKPFLVLVSTLFSSFKLSQVSDFTSHPGAGGSTGHFSRWKVNIHG